MSLIFLLCFLPVLVISQKNCTITTEDGTAIPWDPFAVTKLGSFEKTLPADTVIPGLFIQDVDFADSVLLNAGCDPSVFFAFSANSSYLGSKTKVGADEWDSGKYVPDATDGTCNFKLRFLVSGCNLGVANYEVKVSYEIIDVNLQAPVFNGNDYSINVSF